MNLKEVIDDFIKNNENVTDMSTFLFKNFNDFKDANKILPELMEAVIKTNYNLALGIKFTEILQLADDENLINQYENSDIQNLFKSLIKLQELNLDFYTEAAHFEWAVMDDKEAAKKYINICIEKAKLKITEMEEFLGEMSS